MTTITMTFELSVEDFEAIVESAGYGIGYWASAAVVGETTYYTYEDASPMECYTVTADGFDDLITPALMAKAIGEMFAAGQPGNSLMFQGIDQYVRTGCPGSIGSDVADCIIQWCCFGKIKYG